MVKSEISSMDVGMGLTINDHLKQQQIVLVVIKKEVYLQKEPFIIKAAVEASKKLCFCSFSKPYISIHGAMQQAGYPLERFQFIDVLTSSIQTPDPVPNCSFVSSPGALTDISLAISDAIGIQQCDMVLLDAISTLYVYTDIGSIIKFCQSLITKLRVASKKAVFVALEEDSDALIKDLTMFVDSIVHMG